MKVNKTLSLDYSLVLELQSMKNQSAFVNKAIRSKLGGSVGIDESIPTTQLMGVLLARKDCDPFIKRCLNSTLKQLSKEPGHSSKRAIAELEIEVEVEL